MPPTCLRVLLLPALFALGLPARALEPAPAPATAWLGPANCRVALLDPAPRGGKVTWKGECVDGYASGKGVLAWRSDQGEPFSVAATFVRGAADGEAILKTPAYTYTGTLEQGVPHGLGFFEYAESDGWYEGEVRKGKPHGKGMRLGLDRTSYTGEWAEGKRSGRGEATFATGGSYIGEWKNDEFNGQGKIVYAGSGRSHEGLFVDGRAAGPQGEASTSSDASKSSQEEPGAPFPLDASWNDLTPAHKNALRERYPALEAGDDPPYPAKGKGELVRAVRRINQAYGAMEGALDFLVSVGKDGKPLSVTIHGTPDDEMRPVLGKIFMLAQYKPALCRGEPCAMVYHLRFVFSIDGAGTPTARR